MSTWLTNDELQQRFALLFEHNPSLVLALDDRQRIVDINPAGLRVCGYSREQIVGRFLNDFVLPAQRAHSSEMFARALGGQTVKYRCEAYASDRRVMSFEKTLTPVMHGEQVVVVYALLEDLTEEIAAQRTVESQRETITDLEHDFRALFESNPDGVALLSPNGTIVDVNASAAKIAGVAREWAVGQNFTVFLQGNDLQRGWNFFRRALQGETVRYDTEASVGGRTLCLDVTLLPKQTRGWVAGVYAIIQDTTARRLASRDVEKQTQRVRDLYLLATTAEYTDAHVMSTLQTGCRLLGMESGAIVIAAPQPRVEMRYDSLDFFSGHDDVLLELAQQVGDHRDSVVAEPSAPDGDAYRSWIGTRIAMGESLRGALIFFSKVQRVPAFEEIDRDTLALMSALVAAALERRRTRSHLRTLAYYDSLTGLPNRLSFQDSLRDALVDARGHAAPLAIVYLDLDRFKNINESLGHAVGDRFLQMVAKRLVDAAAGENLVARTGGDEFVVLLRKPEDSLNVERVTKHLLENVARPYLLEGFEQYITASAGVSVYPDDARDDEALVRNADMAMYQAKERGGGAYAVYTPALETPLRSRVDQEKHLHGALERGEFVLHYQPIVEVAGGRIVSVEALLRWQDPERGLIYPDDFIPVAEAYRDDRANRALGYTRGGK